MFLKKREQEPENEYEGIFLVGTGFCSISENEAEKNAPLEENEVAEKPEKEQTEKPEKVKAEKPKKVKAEKPKREKAEKPKKEKAEKPKKEKVEKPKKEKAEKPKKVKPVKEQKGEASTEAISVSGEEKENKKAKKRGSDMLTNVLIVLFSGVFVVCGVLLVRGSLESGKAKDIYSDVNAMMFAGDEYWGMYESDKDVSSPTLKTVTELLRLGISGEVSGAPEKVENVELARTQARISELKRSNPDIYGFIVIEDTNISYPIVRGEDNEFYLNHDPIYRNYLDSGAIFADWRCRKEGLEYNRNTVLYGHNMSRGIMFHDLKKYVEKDFFDTHDIYIYTETGLYVYRPYAFFKTVENHQYFRLIFESDADYLGFLLDTRSYSMHESDIEVTEKDRILTLSTCTNILPGGRYCLQAKLIRVEQ